MNQFIQKFQPHLSGVLTGFDRLVFRGNLGLNHETGMMGYLWANGLGLKDFGTHTEQMSQRVRELSLAVMRSAGRPIRYLNSGKQDKQKIALAIAAADKIGSGP